MKSGSDLKILLALYGERKDAIRRRLNEFQSVPSSGHLTELMYCLLTPQSSARNAEKAVQALNRLGFADHPVDPEPVLRDKRHYIRFHRTKAKRLLELKAAIPMVLDGVMTIHEPEALRDWLVANVKGLGYKEATHFLRNIGRNGELAILDRHILRNLKRFGAVRRLPKTLTKNQYLRLERSFQRLAKSLNIPPNELDLLFWSMETGEILK